VSAKDQFGASRNFVQGLNEAHAATRKLLHHMSIVNNLMEHIEGRAILLKRPFNGRHGHLYTGAEAPGTNKDNLFDRHH
jgi:hypothetical protein